MTVHAEILDRVLTVWDVPLFVAGSASPQWSRINHGHMERRAPKRKTFNGCLTILLEVDF